MKLIGSQRNGGTDSPPPHYIDIAVVNGFIIYKFLEPQENIKLSEEEIAALFGANVTKRRKTEALFSISVSSAKKTSPRKFGKTRHNTCQNVDPLLYAAITVAQRKNHRTKWMCTICKVPLCNNPV